MRRKKGEIDDCAQRKELSIHIAFLYDAAPTPASPVTAPSACSGATSPRLWKSVTRVNSRRSATLRFRVRKQAEMKDGARPTQDLAVHHHFPCINRQVGIVETPVELFLCGWLIRWVMVRGEVLVGESVGGVDTCSRVKDKHLFQEIEG